MGKDKKNIYLSICTPAYNEEEVIEKVIADWQDFIKTEKIKAEIVIGNDGSTDGTERILSKLTKKYSNLVVCSDEHRGYGYALANAIRNASGQLIMTLDSDGQFKVGEFISLHKELKRGRYDLVTGYRAGKKDTLLKVLADRCFNLFIRIFFGLKFKDTNCAQKLFRAEIAQKINIESQGYPTPTEMMIKALELGAKIGEIKTGHYPRIGGKSKLKIIRTSLNALKFFLYLKFKIHLYRKNIITAI